VRPISDFENSPDTTLLVWDKSIVMAAILTTLSLTAFGTFYPSEPQDLANHSLALAIGMFTAVYSALRLNFATQS